MEHFLDIIVLFQFVYQFKYILSLFFIEFNSSYRNPFYLGTDSRKIFFFQGFLHFSEILKSSTKHQNIFTIFTCAFAHFLESIIDQFKLEIFLINSFGFEFETPIFLNWKLTLPLLPKAPFSLLKY